MKKIIILLAVCFLASTGVHAQQKIGHINSQLLLSIMPEMKKAKSDVEKFAKTYQDRLTKMQKEYDSKVKVLQAEAQTMSEAIKEVQIKEIQDLESRIVQLSKTGEKEVAGKEQELAAPIIKRADVAIKAVAAEQGYSYIIDSSTGALLHAKDEDNILKAVKTKLGITN
jgi:outer membrane protein